MQVMTVGQGHCSDMAQDSCANIEPAMTPHTRSGTVQFNPLRASAAGILATLNPARTAASAVRPGRHTLTDHVSNFPRAQAALVETEASFLTSPRDRLIKTRGRLVRHARHTVPRCVGEPLPGQLVAGVATPIGGVWGPPAAMVDT